MEKDCIKLTKNDNNNYQHPPPLQVIRHPRIVQLLGVIGQEPNPGLDHRLIMVMEYLHLGSLKAYLQQNPAILETTLLNFAIDVASGNNIG